LLTTPPLADAKEHYTIRTIRSGSSRGTPNTVRSQRSPRSAYPSGAIIT